MIESNPKLFIVISFLYDLKVSDYALLWNDVYKYISINQDTFLQFLMYYKYIKQK